MNHPPYQMWNTAKGKRWTDCTVERVKLVQHGKLNMRTGKIELEREEVITGPCESPLFSDAEKKTGVCRSCLSGWQVEGNKPTERGLAQIEAAKVST